MKTSSTIIIKIKRCILIEELAQRLCNLGKIFNKSYVKSNIP